MANIVTIQNRRYMVDVGYGADGPVTPLPLVSGEICEGLTGQQLKLEHKRLPQHRDPNQRVWVYSQRRANEQWEEVYHFLDVEFFPPDFEVLNHHATTKSLWASTVVAQKFVFGSGEKLSGTLLLLRDELKSGDGLSKATHLLGKLKDEDERITTLQEHFAIVLTEEEQHAIEGRGSDLGRPGQEK